MWRDESPATGRITDVVAADLLGDKVLAVKRKTGVTGWRPSEMALNDSRARSHAAVGIAIGGGADVA